MIDFNETLSGSTDRNKSIIDKYFTLWKRKTYSKRANRLFERRLGIDFKTAGSENLLHLKKRIVNLNSPMSQQMKDFLMNAKRSAYSGLTREECILYDRILTSDWRLIHVTDNESLESIKSSGNLKSAESLLREGKSAWMTGYVDEAVDSIFFTISPGASCQKTHEYFGENRIEIDLKTIDPVAIKGWFISGCVYIFRRNTENSNFGVLYDSSFSVQYNDVDGEVKRSYGFHSDGEFITHQVSKTCEIYTSPIEAMGYILIERIRQLGFSAWQRVYSDIETADMNQLHELFMHLMGKMLMEAHIPRQLNINQPGIQVIQSEQEPNHEANMLISAAYNGQLELLKTVSRNALKVASACLTLEDEELPFPNQLDRKVDIITAAFLGGHMDTVDYLLPLLAPLSEFSTFSANVFFSAVSSVLGLELSEKYQWVKLRMSKMISVEQVNELLQTLFQTGIKNPINSNIYYLAHYSDFMNLDLFSISSEYQRDNFGSEWYMTLLRDRGFFSERSEVVQYSHPKETVFIVKGESWYLLESAKNPVRMWFGALRTNRSYLELLDISHQSLGCSDEVLCNKVAFQYYGLRDSEIELVDTLEQDGQTLYVIQVSSSEQCYRLERQFCEQIIYLKDFKAVSPNHQAAEVVCVSGKKVSRKSFERLTSMESLNDFNQLKI